MDVLAGQSQVEIAVIVVVSPGQFSIVHVEQNVTVELIHAQSAAIIGIQPGCRRTIGVHPRYHEVQITVTVGIAPGEIRVAHAHQDVGAGVVGLLKVYG